MIRPPHPPATPPPGDKAEGGVSDMREGVEKGMGAKCCTPTPRSQGGTHTTDNLRTAHRRCNSLRSTNIRTDAEVRAIVLGLTA